MRLLEGEIINFGKLNKKELTFTDGINLIYGENEAGKSTIHTFIRSIFFDVERARGRAASTDAFHKFEPWEQAGPYGGSLIFQSGGKKFLLKRRFDRNKNNSSLVCLDDGEELQVEDGDLNMLLSGMTSAVYDNTLSIGQLMAAPTHSLAHELQNYATNYYASGESDLDVEAALDILKKEKKSFERRQGEKQKKRQDKRTRIEQEATVVWRDLHRHSTRQEDLEEELRERSEELRKLKEEQENGHTGEENPIKRWRVHPGLIILFMFIVMAVLCLIERPLNVLAAIVVVIMEGIYTWNRMKISKKPEKTESEILLETIDSSDEEMTMDRLLWEIERSKSEVEEKQIQYNNLREQLEEIDYKDEEDHQLEIQIEAVTLAMRKIEELSMGMQKQMILRLNEKISEIVKELTEGRYEKLFMDQDLNLSLLTKGQVVYLRQLSRGTIELIYFALRMAAAEVLTDEDMPILLDDTFVAYDDKRLKNVLTWLGKQKRQVLLFSCQKREKNIMEEAKVPFHLIEL